MYPNAPKGPTLSASQIGSHCTSLCCNNCHWQMMANDVCSWPLDLGHRCSTQTTTPTDQSDRLEPSRENRTSPVDPQKYG
jgi:hypothetical protein